MNQTASYLDGAELQFETDQQRAILERAFDDILMLPIQGLCAQQYPDYAGNEGKWSLAQVFERYIVPNSAQKGIGPAFYEELKTVAVQATIERMREAVRKMDP